MLTWSWPPAHLPYRGRSPLPFRRRPCFDVPMARTDYGTKTSGRGNLRTDLEAAHAAARNSGREERPQPTLGGKAIERMSDSEWAKVLEAAHTMAGAPPRGPAAAAAHRKGDRNVSGAELLKVRTLLLLSQASAAAMLGYNAASASGTFSAADIAAAEGGSTTISNASLNTAAEKFCVRT
jgi:hypothetical protein